MLRNVLAVVLAFVAGNLLIFAGQAVNAMVHPFPEGFDFFIPLTVAATRWAVPKG